MKLAKFLLLVVLGQAAVLAACSQPPTASSERMAQARSAPSPTFAAEIAADVSQTTLRKAVDATGAAEPPAGAPAVSALGSLSTGQADRYLIKNATIMIETESSRAATDQLAASLQAVGGYIASLNESVDGLGRRSVTVQVRVPAQQFDQSMTQLEALGRILNKQVSTQDVTEEYIDTDARTRNLKKTEERLIEH